jgi:hypothetical protein
MRGVLDRFEENDQAIILIEEIQKALVIPRSDLPKGSEQGTWFLIENKNANYRIISIDHETTKRQKEKSNRLMEKLREKSSGSKFKRN